MYKQNDEQRLIHTKVTLGEHETKSLHLCQITTWHTTQFYTSKIYLDQNYSSIVVWVFLALHLILTIFFSVIVNISCINIVRVVGI